MDIYEAIIPIYVDNLKVGTLAIFYSLEFAYMLTNQISKIVLMLLVFIFGVYGIMSMIIIKKNRNIERHAYFDPVTDLFNYNYLMSFLDEKLKYSTIKNRALIIVHCSNLNLIKLISGQAILNDLLVKKAGILQGLDIDEGEIFKYSENTYLIYLNHYKDREHIINISNKIIESFKGLTKEIDSNKMSKTKVGILEIDEEIGKADDAIKYTDIILNRLEEVGEEGYFFFEERIQEDILINEIIEEELRMAASKGFAEEFFLEYQPLIDSKTNKIIALEALARWKSKKLGYISPYKFINIAEKTLLIIPLGHWILLTACKFMKRLEDNGFNNIKIAINISVIQLLQDNFIENLMAIIKETGVEPWNLQLEITESILMDNYEIINEKLKILRDIGINISLDDFGTGYSSLARLNKLNIDLLKIDKSFIENIENIEENNIFINNIISLANQLDLKVVAEGVETQVQKDYLLAKSCDIMQGYLFSKPISTEKTIELLKDKNQY